MEGKSLPTLVFESSPKEISSKKRKNIALGSDFGQKRRADCLQSDTDNSSFWSFDVSRDSCDKNTGNQPPEENAQALKLNDLTQTSQHPDAKVENDREEDKNAELKSEHKADLKDDRSGQIFSELVSRIGQEAKMAVLQFSQALEESELFEEEGLQAISDLQNHAEDLKQKLMSQKEILSKRLKVMSENLLNLEQ